MRIPYSLLKRCLAEELSPEQIEKALVGVGIEVDATTTYAPSFCNVIVAQVVETSPHPNADRLRLAKVDTGSEVIEVVCGAPNCRPGMRVAFAKEGASLKDGKNEFVIKKTTIRGVASSGMLCSEKELGFSQESEGILELNESFQLGEDLYTRLSDTIFELSLTPNLGYCLSVEGVAKEISRATGVRFIPWKEPVFKPFPKREYTISLPEPALCPRYGYAVLDHVLVQPSPIDIRLLLNRCGFSSINNVVDASNLVMLIIGHPLHCFDRATLPAQEIEVRESRPQESLTLLDSKQIKLQPHSLLITSQTIPLALAGVMGGLTTAVSNTTTSLFVEAAYFNPKAIRRSRKANEISTEASRRFERGTDPNVLERALLCFQEMVIKDVPTVRVVEQAVVGMTLAERTILLRESAVRALLGIDVSIDEIEQALSRSALSWASKEASQFVVRIPPARHDLLEEADLIEEVIKTIGYDRLTADPKPAPYLPSALRDHPLYEMQSWARHFCTSIGLQEWVTCDLIAPNEAEELLYNHITPQEIVHVANPLSIEQSVLRPSLLPGLLSCLVHNYARQEANIRVFEVGNISLKHGGKYVERPALGILLAGERTPFHFSLSQSSVDFFDMKGIVEQIAKALRLEGVDIRPSHVDHLHPKRQAAVFLAQQQVGVFGEMHPMLLKKKGIQGRLYCLELDLKELYQHRDPSPIQTMPLTLYPAMERDWTVTLPSSISYAELIESLSTHLPPTIEAIELVSIFTSDRIGIDKKNVTLRFRFRDREKTLVQEEVEASFALLVKEASLALGLVTKT